MVYGRYFFMIIATGGLIFNTQENSGTTRQQYNIVSDTLYWDKNRKLTWEDFQGLPDFSTIYGANTVSGFLTKSKYTSDTSISVTIAAVFYKNKSWQKCQYQTPQSLVHEQGHFDITEVYARKATAAFKKYKYNKETVNRDIDSIVNFYFTLMSRKDDLYDKETSYHRNSKKQEEWNAKISMWLEENN